jgi:hypothetical protein
MERDLDTDAVEDFFQTCFTENSMDNLRLAVNTVVNTTQQETTTVMASSSAPLKRTRATMCTNYASEFVTTYLALTPNEPQTTFKETILKQFADEGQQRNNTIKDLDDMETVLRHVDNALDSVWMLTERWSLDHAYDSEELRTIYDVTRNKLLQFTLSGFEPAFHALSRFALFTPHFMFSVETNPNYIIQCIVSLLHETQLGVQKLLTWVYILLNKLFKLTNNPHIMALLQISKCCVRISLLRLECLSFNYIILVYKFTNFLNAERAIEYFQTLLGVPVMPVYVVEQAIRWGDIETFVKSMFANVVRVESQRLQDAKQQMVATRKLKCARLIELIQTATRSEDEDSLLMNTTIKTLLDTVPNI